MITLNGFENVCSSAYTTKGMNDIACECLQVLANAKDKMTPKEIAQVGGFFSHQTVAKELIWLAELGLVERIEEFKPTTILTDEWKCEPKDNKPFYITVNGVEYRRTDNPKTEQGHWEKVEITVNRKLVYYKYIAQ